MAAVTGQFQTFGTNARHYTPQCHNASPTTDRLKPTCQEHLTVIGFGFECINGLDCCGAKATLDMPSFITDHGRMWVVTWNLKNWDWNKCACHILHLIDNTSLNYGMIDVRLQPLYKLYHCLSRSSIAWKNTKGSSKWL